MQWYSFPYLFFLFFFPHPAIVKPELIIIIWLRFQLSSPEILSFTHYMHACFSHSRTLSVTMYLLKHTITSLVSTWKYLHQFHTGSVQGSHSPWITTVFNGSAMHTLIYGCFLGGQLARSSSGSLIFHEWITSSWSISFISSSRWNPECTQICYKYLRSREFFSVISKWPGPRLQKKISVN